MEKKAHTSRGLKQDRAKVAIAAHHPSIRNRAVPEVQAMHRRPIRNPR
jgi:hypothetical protein